MDDRELIAAILTAGMLPTLEIPQSRARGRGGPVTDAESEAIQRAVDHAFGLYRSFLNGLRATPDWIIDSPPASHVARIGMRELYRSLGRTTKWRAPDCVKTEPIIYSVVSNVGKRIREFWSREAEPAGCRSRARPCSAGPSRTNQPVCPAEPGSRSRPLRATGRRKEAGYCRGAIVIVMQRLHEDDLVGHVLGPSKRMRGVIQGCNASNESGFPGPRAHDRN
jgi:hypothetical protein